MRKSVALTTHVHNVVFTNRSNCWRCCKLCFFLYSFNVEDYLVVFIQSKVGHETWVIRFYTSFGGAPHRKQIFCLCSNVVESYHIFCLCWAKLWSTSAISIENKSFIVSLFVMLLFLQFHRKQIDRFHFWKQLNSFTKSKSLFQVLIFHFSFLFLPFWMGSIVILETCYMNAFIHCCTNKI